MHGPGGSLRVPRSPPPVAAPAYNARGPLAHGALNARGEHARIPEGAPRVHDARWPEPNRAQYLYNEPQHVSEPPHLPNEQWPESAPLPAEHIQAPTTVQDMTAGQRALPSPPPSQPRPVQAGVAVRGSSQQRDRTEQAPHDKRVSALRVILCMLSCTWQTAAESNAKDLRVIEHCPKQQKRARAMTTSQQAPTKRGRKVDAISVLDSDEDTLDLGRKWTIEERSQLFEFVLGTDSDDMFELVLVNPSRVWEKVCT